MRHIVRVQINSYAEVSACGILLYMNTQSVSKEMDSFLATLAQKIREARQRQGYSQEDFAAAVGMDRSYYGSVERGERNIGVANLVRITETLKITMSELLEIDIRGLNTPDNRNANLVAFGLHLRKLREERGLSEREFSYALGIHITYWSQVERGLSDIGVMTLFRVAAELGIDVADLFPKPHISEDATNSSGEVTGSDPTA